MKALNLALTYIYINNAAVSCFIKKRNTHLILNIFKPCQTESCYFLLLLLFIHALSPVWPGAGFLLWVPVESSVCVCVLQRS